jgi:S-adenosyl methyltransferase
MTASEWDFRGIDPGEEHPDIDTSVAHSARIYDYILGGKDNFEADRKAAADLIAANPNLATAMRENRAMMRRMVRFLAAEAGITQFLDIGTGLPASPNVHEIAQGIHPAARIVYVDNDPIVLAHARALLTSNPQGATAYIDADARDPGKILGHPRLLSTLDLSQPVAVMLLGIMHLITDADDPQGMVSRYVAAMAPGSYLAIHQPTTDVFPPGVGDDVTTAYRNNGIAIRYRTREEFARFTDGLDLVRPGITITSEWRSEDEPQPRPPVSNVCAYGALARKP